MEQSKDTQTPATPKEVLDGVHETRICEELAKLASFGGWAYLLHHAREAIDREINAALDVEGGPQDQNRIENLGWVADRLRDIVVTADGLV